MVLPTTEQINAAYDAAQEDAVEPGTNQVSNWKEFRGLFLFLFMIPYIVYLCIRNRNRDVPEFDRDLYE